MADLAPASGKMIVTTKTRTDSRSRPRPDHGARRRLHLRARPRRSSRSPRGRACTSLSSALPNEVVRFLSVSGWPALSPSGRRKDGIPAYEPAALPACKTAPVTASLYGCGTARRARRPPARRFGQLGSPNCGQCTDKTRTRLVPASGLARGARGAAGRPRRWGAGQGRLAAAMDPAARHDPRGGATYPIPRLTQPLEQPPAWPVLG